MDMHNTAPRSNAFDPFLPDDFWQFMDAKSIRREHRTRGQSPESGHTMGDHRNCGGCFLMAHDGLLAYAGRANARGWTREEGLRELEAHPAAFDSMVKEGRRRERVANGRLAKPYEAAFGAVYEKALRRASDADALSVPVRAAQEFLGFAIEAVQDQSSVIEHGHWMPWEALEERLAAGPFALPRGLRAWHLWDEIIAAFDRVPRASAMVDDHVFQHSAAASRQTAAHHASASDGSVLDPIDNATDSSALGAGVGFDDLGIIGRVVDRLVARDRVDLEAALSEGTRALADRLGRVPDHGPETAMVDQVAHDAITIARRDLAIRDAATAIRGASGGRTMTAIEAIEAAFAERGVGHPYDLDTEDGREAHGRWLAVAAREARLLAR